MGSKESKQSLKGTVSQKYSRFPITKEFFDDLKSSIISAVTQSSVDHNQVNNNDNSNAGNAFGGCNEAKRCKTGSNRD